MSYFLLAVFLISNRWIPAGYVMILGLLLNLVVVVANGGMPVRAEAITTSGGDPAVLQDSTVGKHHLMTEDDVLWHLGDVIGVPPPISVVLSPGDVLLYGGIVFSIVQIMRGRRARTLGRWRFGSRRTEGSMRLSIGGCRSGTAILIPLKQRRREPNRDRRAVVG